MNCVIYGINGKMGQTLLSEAPEFPEINITGGVDASGICLAVPTYRTAAEIKAVPDVIIDFSRPSALPDILSYALKHGVKLVLCTTGYSEDDEKKIAEAAKKTAVFKSGNMSVGINLIVNLVEQAAKVLGDAFDIEIVEKHHNMKVDAPSGTALMLADAANAAFSGKKKYIYGRSGPDCKRDGGDITLHSVRGGTLVGEHEVMFIGKDEAVTISHTAFSRKILASGAFKAALSLKDKKPGLYSFKNF